MGRVGDCKEPPQDECQNNNSSTAHVPGGYLKEVKKKEKHVRFGPRHKTMFTQFLPGAIVYGLASLVAMAYFIDWRIFFPAAAKRLEERRNLADTLAVQCPPGEAAVVEEKEKDTQVTEEAAMPAKEEEVEVQEKEDSGEAAATEEKTEEKTN